MNYYKKTDIDLNIMELKILLKFLENNIFASDIKNLSLNKIKNKLRKGLNNEH